MSVVSYIPEGFHTVTPYFIVADGPAFLAFLKQAFSAEEHFVHRTPQGRIMHAEMRIGDSIVEFGEANAEWSAMRLNNHVYVPDTDAVYRRALAAGAKSLREPKNEAEVQLLVLGVDDVAVTPAQLARAYFRLARNLDATPVVRRGLERSVAYGMAHNAATAGMTIAGKTGTAGDAGEAWTHGWFAGIVSHGAEQLVVVIYLPRGNGADAALLAHRFFALWGRTS